MTWSLAGVGAGRVADMPARLLHRAWDSISYLKGQVLQNTGSIEEDPK